MESSTRLKTAIKWGLAIILLSQGLSLQAANVYWDGGTTDITGNGNNSSSGGAGSWNTTLKNWDAGTSAHVAWNNAGNNTAVFASSSGLVTLGSDVMAGALTFSVSGYSLDGTHTLTLNNTGTTLSGNALVISSGLTLKLGADQTWATGVSGAGTVDTNGKTLTVGTQAVKSVISGTGNLTFQGNYSSGTPNQLGVANTYTGVTTITGGTYVLETGALKNAGTASGFGASGAASSNIVLNGCTLQSGWSSGGTNNASTDHGLTLIGNVTIYTKNTGQNPAFNGLITGAGNLQISGDSGSGAVILGANNDFTGECRQGGGGTMAPTVSLANVNALRNATLNMNQVNFAVATTPALAYVIGGLKGTTNLALNSTGSGSVSFGNNNLPNSYAGILSGTVNFIKIGTGTQTLTGANTYSGTTLVSTGTLAISGSGSVANTPTITVATGATLDVSGVTGGFTLGASQTLTGTGTVKGLVMGGQVLPGVNGVGTLTMSNDYTQTAGGALNLIARSATSSPALIVNGTATLNGILNVTFADGYVPVLNDTLVVVRADTALTGSFATTHLPGLPSGLGWQMTTASRTITLQVVAVATTMSITPASFAFGNVLTGATTQTTFTVTNTGATTLTGTATVTGAPFSVISGGSYSLGAGASANVVVAFSPTAVGTFNDGLHFVSNGGDATHPLTGNGIIPALLTVTPVSNNFGAILHGTTAQATFVVTNGGGLPLTGTAAVTGAPFSVTSGGAFTVAGGGSTNVVVQFAPSTAGAFSDVVAFTSNGGTATRMISGTSLAVTPDVPTTQSVAYNCNILPGMPNLSASGEKFLAVGATLKQTFIPRSDSFLTAFNAHDGNGVHQIAVTGISLKLDAYQNTPATFNVAISRVESGGARTLYYNQDFQQGVYGQTVRTWTFSQPILLSADAQYEVAIKLVQGGVNSYGGGIGGVGLYTAASDYPDGACSAGGDLWFALSGTTALPVFPGLALSAAGTNAYFIDAGPLADSSNYDNLKGKFLGVAGHPEQLVFTCPAGWPALTFELGDAGMATVQAQGSGGNYTLTLNGVTEGETFLFAKAGTTIVGYLKIQCHPRRNMNLSYSYVKFPAENPNVLMSYFAGVTSYISAEYEKANIGINWTDNGVLAFEWDLNGDGSSYSADYSEVWSPITYNVLPNKEMFFSNVFMLRYNKDDAYQGGINGGGTSMGFGLPGTPPRGANVRAHLFGSTTQYGSTLAHELGHNLGLYHTGVGTDPTDNLMDVGRSGDNLYAWQWKIIHNTLGVLFDVPPVAALTAPANGATALLPGNVTLTASIVQNRNPITKVRFFADGTTLLGTATTAPYTCTWTNPTIGTHALTAVVTDNQGMTTTSAAVNLTVANSTHTLTYTAGANGTITGTTPQTVNHNADGTAVTAVPNTGCAFVNWSDSRTDNPRTDVNVTTNLSVTANFALTPYGLWMQAIANPILRDPLADADGDGAPNLLEFAYGGDPITATSHVTAKTAIQSGDSSQPFTLTIPVRAGASFATTPAGPMLATVDGVTCRVEASSDLTNWTEPVAEVSPALSTDMPAAPAGYTYHTFRLTGSTAATPRAFIRFKALLP